MDTPKKPKRSADQTLLTVSLPRELKERIAAAAKKERRKMSPWVAIQLENALDAMEPARYTVVERDPPMAADEGNGTE